jgi:N-acetylneuraminic acid mutarotase
MALHASNVVSRVANSRFVFLGLGALIVLIAIIGGRTLSPDKEVAGSSGAVSTMGTARYSHTATLLPNGKVLIVGGRTGVDNSMLAQALPSASAELYDPSSNTWSPTASLAAARDQHTATLLSNGKVLVAGGDDHGTAELYDPSSGTWSPAGTMAEPRSQHTATLLLTGNVLVAGGSHGTTSAELYDPSTNSWSAARDLNSARRDHTATLLPGGNVFVDGGYGQRSGELYDPSSNVWSSTGAAWFGQVRRYHTASLLPNGKVLIAGGEKAGMYFIGSATIYDPSSNTWSSAGRMVRSRQGHTATLLSTGKVLVAGGVGFSLFGIYSVAELYDPSSDSWSKAGPLTTARWKHTATLLPSGKVLFAGGVGKSHLLSTAELYDPTQPSREP